MHYLVRLSPVMILLVLLTGCAASQSSGESGSDRNLITREQIEEHTFHNAYDLVEGLRSNWLRTRGTDSFRSPTQVQVYVNDSRMGGINELRSVATQDIAYVRYYDANAATARWGLNHGQGAIYVSTRPGR